MKKLLFAILLLLSSIVYLIVRLTKETLYIKEFSAIVDNPISLHWLYLGIEIETGFNSSASIYKISLIPIYIIFLIVIILVAFSLINYSKK